MTSLRIYLRIIVLLDDLKIAMRAEAKAWKVLYGRKMNSKHLDMMEKIMELIEDLSRKLSRPINDLDDVRQAMAALKELRDNEIFIDSSLDPIEVCQLDIIGERVRHCQGCTNSRCCSY